MKGKLMYQLYIKQKVFKITDHYQIDNNGIPRYQVDQDFKLKGIQFMFQKSIALIFLL